MRAVRRIMTAMAFLAGMASPAIAAMSDADRHAYATAFQQADKGHWTTARRLAGRGGDPLPAKIMDWLYASDGDSGASFEEIAGFLRANPHWPGQRHLARLAELALDDHSPPETVLAWFDGRQPRTTYGATLYGRALLDADRKAEGKAVLRDAWRDGSFGRVEQSSFLRRYRRFLTRDDHKARLDRLLWDGSTVQAERMLRLVPNGERALAIARIRLRRLSGGVDLAIARVPASLADHPGLRFDRLRWRRLKKRDNAADLLESKQGDVVRPELWAAERVIIAQRLLADGEISHAYDVVRAHRTTQGYVFARSEFLAGWIALRFLNDPEAAFSHFTRMDAGVETPISKARAAYWAGRAATASGDTTDAKAWFTKAAQYHGTYYGQLAKERVSIGPAIVFDDPPGPGPSPPDGPGADELLRAARFLAEIGRADLIDPFIDALAEPDEAPPHYEALAREAEALGRPDLAVDLARDAYRDEGKLLSQGYPVIPLDAANAPERALVLSLIRQESGFDPEAISSNGARGLMQLLPSTARHIARAERVRYVRSKLTRDADYNLRLGQAYLSKMLDRFGGSYVLATAAYNAGPAAVNRWIDAFGDPRDAKVDAIDWVESIPYAETRNYVQRILEAVQVYRSILGTAGPEASLERDLVR